MKLILRKEGLEGLGWLQFILMRLLVKIISQPKIGYFLFIKHSRMGRFIRRLASQYKCLEIIYNYERRQTRGRPFVERALTDILLKFANAKAVRNRLKLVERIIESILQKLDHLEIISLAAGSGRDVLDVFSKNPNGNKALFIDKSKAALNFSKNLAAEKGIEANCSWVRGLVEEFVQNGKRVKPNLVLMVGFLDYPTDEEAVEIFKQIYRILKPGGYFITSNIVDNPERKFLHQILNWPKMKYRSEKQLSSLLIMGGFKDFQIIPEPLGIHLVALCYKPNNP